MRTLKAIVFLLAIVVLISGCSNQGKEPLSQPQASPTSQSSKQNGFEYVTDQEVFYQSDADGREIWFDRWHLGEGDNFTIGGKVFDRGLGISEMTTSGINDPRSFAYVRYKALKGEYSSITGTFGFDDSTKVKADSRLIAYSKDEKIFESPNIGPSLNSLDIEFTLPQDTADIAFRFETNFVDGTVSRVVFADIKAKRAD